MTPDGEAVSTAFRVPLTGAGSKGKGPGKKPEAKVFIMQGLGD
ncbi:hypothetical protein [Pelagibius sp.]|nr:hypothetical protein [Pelagibius sp.]